MGDARLPSVSGAASAGLQVRGGYGQVQHYYQTFSSVSSPAAPPKVPTSEQNVDASAFGPANRRVQRWSRFAFAFGLAAAGRHVAADLKESELPRQGFRLRHGPSTRDQSTYGGSAVGIWGWPGFDLWSAPARVDELANHARRPRIGTRSSVRASWLTTAPRSFRINVAVQSGSRGPTINELYRPFRVGNTFTRANPLLKPEDVRGFEAGVSHSLGRSTVRVLGFGSRWTMRSST